MKKAILLFLPLLFGNGISAYEVTSQGEVRLESRAFEDDSKDSTNDYGHALFTRIESKVEKDSYSFNFRGFSRVDGEDSSRNLLGIEESYFSYSKNSLELKAGYQIHNWTATEAFHPADILNSRNLDSNIENPEKFGELTVSGKYLLSSGSITLYYLPQFVAPKIPAGSNRLTLFPSPTMAVTNTKIMTKDNKLEEGQWQPQYGAQLNYTIGSTDIGLAYIDHIDRQQPAINFLSSTDIQLVYSRVRHFGLTLTQAIGDYLLKVEAANRDFAKHTTTNYNTKDHGQVALGLERPYSSESGKDHTFIIEAQGLTGLTKNERRDLSLFQNDILVGYRLAFNDILSREIFVSIISDLERSNETLFNINYSQRLSDVWSIKGSLRVVEAPQKESLPYGLERLNSGDQLSFSLSRFF